jgi:hypothetical protein
MPFTLSHAAAALPLRRFRPIWPALIVGTFAPDLQYFVSISDESRSGHRFPDILLLTVPLALIALWLFEYIVKGPAIELLPTGFQCRLRDKAAPLPFAGWWQFSRIVFWVAIGIVTHIGWDQFTHSHTWLSDHWALLRTLVTVPYFQTISVAHLLQQVSTIFGMAVLGVWVLAWYRRTPPSSEMFESMFSTGQKVAMVLSIAAVSLLLGYPIALWKLADHLMPIRRTFFIVTVFEATTLVFCIQLLIYAASVKLATRQRDIRTGALDQTGD